jgi:outer membrane immunogenic protein
MKKFLLTLTAVAAMTGSAFAADMAPRTYAKAPIVAPVASWTGFWISGGFGYGLGQYESSVNNIANNTAFDIGHDTGMKGWLGKVGAGYDYQFAGPMGNWVVGAFVDASWSNISGRNSFTCPGACDGPTQGYNGGLTNDWSWAVGGRLGYVALPNLLTYFNGGFTQADLKGINYVDPNGVAGPSLGSRRLNGWFIGGGTEYAITQIPGLFWKSEVRFSKFGDRTDTNVCAAGALACTPVANHSLDRNRLYEQMATTELVYRFNWGGPVVAKY